MCYKTKEFLSKHQVAFTEVNVLANPKALLKLVATFRKIAPVVVVGDEPISGFNRKRLRRALGIEPGR